MGALDATALVRNTVVMLWAGTSTQSKVHPHRTDRFAPPQARTSNICWNELLDHGWALGENNEWGKHVRFEACLTLLHKYLQSPCLCLRLYRVMVAILLSVELQTTFVHSNHVPFLVRLPPGSGAETVGSRVSSFSENVTSPLNKHFFLALANIIIKQMTACR